MRVGGGGGGGGEVNTCRGGGEEDSLIPRLNPQMKVGVSGVWEIG